MSSSKAVTETSSNDRLLLWAAGGTLLLGLIGFYWFGEQSLLLRTIALLVVVGMCVWLVWQTALGKRIFAFFRDARTEVRKVIWPSRQETMQTTLTVFIIVFIVGLILWMFDLMLNWAFSAVTGI